MKKLLLASLLALGLSAGYTYAENKATLELEHANKLATGDDSVAGDMAEMKAAGKCAADQNGKIKKKVKRKVHKPTKAELELEHANKLATGDDSVDADMGDMKAQGKCSGSEKKLKNSASKCGASHKEKNAGKCAGDKTNPKKAQKTMKCGQGKCGGNN